MLNCFSIKDNSSISKIQQIVSHIREQIHAGLLVDNEMLPSINQLSKNCLVARDTVEKAYGVLRSQGYVTSVKGKGYFISAAPFNTLKILIIVNDVNFPVKKFKSTVPSSSGDAVSIDYKVNSSSRGKLIRTVADNRSKYDYCYILSPVQILSGERRRARLTGDGESLTTLNGRR